MRLSVCLIMVWMLCLRAMAMGDSLYIAPKSTKHISPLIPVLTATAGIGLSLVLDRPVNSMAYRNQSSLSHDITNVTDLMGSKNLMVPALLATFGGSFLIKDDKLKSTSWNAIKSVVTTSITVEMLKVSIGRARPFVGEGNMSFHPFNGNDIYKSMPSGHSSFAFALFTPFAETYSRWIYVLPASVAIGRVWQQKHWLSDVVIGGGIGWLSGYLFTHSKKKIVVTPNGFVIWF